MNNGCAILAREYGIDLRLPHVGHCIRRARSQFAADGGKKVFDIDFSQALAAVAKTNHVAAEYMMERTENGTEKEQPFLATVLRARLQQALYDAVMDEKREQNDTEGKGGSDNGSNVDICDDYDSSEKTQRRKRRKQINIHRGQAGTIKAAWDASRSPLNTKSSGSVHVKKSSTGAFIQTEDGRCHGPFDLIVGADGVNSLIRRVIASRCGDNLNADDKPKYANVKVFYTLRKRTIPVSVAEEKEEESTDTSESDSDGVDAPPHELRQYLCDRSVVVRYPVADDVDMIAFLVHDNGEDNDDENGSSTRENVTFSHIAGDVNHSQCGPSHGNEGSKDSDSDYEGSSHDYSDWSKSMSESKERNDSDVESTQQSNNPQHHDRNQQQQQQQHVDDHSNKMNTHEQHIRASTVRLMHHCRVPLHLITAWNSGFRYISIAVHEHSCAAQRRWTDGKQFVLVGDAAHAMTPFMAQGANQTVQDAHFLALCLRRRRGEQGLPGALREYEAMFRDEVRRLTRKSRMLGELLTKGGTFGAVMRRIVLTVVGRTGVLQKEMVKSILPRFDATVTTDVT